MYHYVQKFNPREKYAKYLHFKNFEKQIIFFKKKYLFFDCKNIENFYLKENFQKKIFLTFDDSLKSHYKYVFKILKKHKLNGIFYVPTLPYTQKKILEVHKIHLILRTFGELIAYKQLKKIIELKMIDGKNKKFFQNKIYKNQSNSFEENYFKKLLNYYIKDKYKSYLIKKLFNYFFSDLDEERFCTNFYLTEKEIKIMANNGMVFGGHTISHRVISKLSKKEMYREIKSSVDFAYNFSPFKTFSYPYGGFHTFNNHAEKFLEKQNVKFSMNVENKDIRYKDFIKRPQALSRFDCNVFPFGKIQNN